MWSTEGPPAMDITPSDQTVSLHCACISSHPSILSCFAEILASLQILIILKCHIYPFNLLTSKFLQKMLFSTWFFVCHDTNVASALLRKQFLTKEQDFPEDKVPKCAMFYFGAWV